MAHRDRVGGSSGRRNGAGDAVHRQNLSTSSDGPPTRPERRLAKAFGRRRPRFAMPRIACASPPAGETGNAIVWYAKSCKGVLERSGPPWVGATSR